MAYIPKAKLTRRMLQQAVAVEDFGLLDNVDQRYGVVKRLKELTGDLVYDHGPDLSTAATCLLQRCAFLILQAELIEAKWATRNLGPKPAVLASKGLREHTALLNSLRRTFAAMASVQPPRRTPPPSIVERFPHGFDRTSPPPGPHLKG